MGHVISSNEINGYPNVDKETCIGCATCATGYNCLVYRLDFEQRKSVVFDPLNCLAGYITCHNSCPVDLKQTSSSNF
jgi:TPP-dependent indolepyruvate ferredoxin oxidoreductase alpha subunit